MSDVILKNVTKKFGENVVLSDFSYTFKSGETTCIVGPSGCGKTTLLNMIMGIQQPGSGEISGVPEKISCVFQENRLCEDFSAVSNVKFVTGTSENVRENLERLGITDFSGPVKKFSGGMKRRVAIVRAMCYDGELVIMDEPFKGLDEKLKKITMDYVAENIAGKTVIMVTHDREEVDFFADNVLDLGDLK